MLKITPYEKEILDALLRASPKAVANSLKINPQVVYSVKHNFRRKTQNAEEFLSVAHSKYAPLLKKRLKTPKIMPVTDEEW